MPRIPTICIVIVVLGLTCFGQSQDEQKRIDSALSAAKLGVSTQTVESVTITHVYPEILTRAQLTPDSLDQIASFRIVVTRDGIGHEAKSLTSALQDTATEPGDHNEVRWGVVFRGSDKKVLLAAYFDRYCSKGFINGISVKFKDAGICEWAKTVSSGLAH
jgi:hypothetical protein